MKNVSGKTLAPAAAIFLCAGAAHAQSEPPASDAAPTADVETGGDGEALADIVVTAQKREENLQRVPISIAAVSPTQLENAAVLTANDLPRVVPGLTLLNSGGVITPRLRGVGTTSVTPGNEAPVAIYVDGVYYSFQPEVNLDLFDVTQVSVLKGPQGTLFGRNATGGVVQFTTRDPTQDFELKLATSLDNYLTSRSNIYIGGGLADDVAAGLAVSYVTQGRGWGKNLFNGNDAHRIKHSVTLRGKLVYDGPDTTAKLSVDYGDTSDNLATAYRPYPGYDVQFPSPQSPDKWDVNSYLDGFYTFAGGGVVAHCRS